ncbi:hypothetical protein T484DRAFT_1768540, partial [Baffinella frigidus]
VAEDSTQRIVQITLRKKAPGENFVPSVLKEWEEEYDGEGCWRESILKIWWNRVMKYDRPVDVSHFSATIWWNRVMKYDRPVDVSHFSDRDHDRAMKLDAAWKEALLDFGNATDLMKPVNITPLMEEDCVEHREEEIAKALRKEGIEPGTSDWASGMLEAQRLGMEDAEREAEVAHMRREQRCKDDDEVERAWKEREDLRGASDFSTQLDTDGEEDRLDTDGEEVDPDPLRPYRPSL